MENFATKDLEILIEKLNAFKTTEEIVLETKIGLTKQFIRDNIEGVTKTINIVEKALADIKAIT